MLFGNPTDFNYNVSIKFLIIGDSNVGKTSIIKSLKNKNSYIKSTIGIEYDSFILNLEPYKIKCQLWDVGGYRFNCNEMDKYLLEYYSIPLVSIIVFDLSDQRSFLNVNNYIKKLINLSNTKYLIILGNKLDNKNFEPNITPLLNTYAKCFTKIIYKQITSYNHDCFRDILIHLITFIFSQNEIEGHPGITLNNKKIKDNKKRVSCCCHAICVRKKYW